MYSTPNGIFAHSDAVFAVASNEVEWCQENLVILPPPNVIITFLYPKEDFKNQVDPGRELGIVFTEDFELGSGVDEYDPNLAKDEHYR